MCLINSIQTCGICGGPIRSPIRMRNHISCEEDAVAAVRRGRVKVDPIKGDLREAQIEKRRKITEDAVKRAKPTKPAKKKSGHKKKPARKSWDAFVRENQW